MLYYKEVIIFEKSIVFNGISDRLYNQFKK